MKIPENILSTLTDEQKKKIEAADSPEELLTLAKETGYELTEAQLEGVAGGWCPAECSGDTCMDDCPLYSPR